MGHKKPRVSPASKGSSRGKKPAHNKKDEPSATPITRYLNKNFFFIGLLAGILGGILVPFFPHIWQYFNQFGIIPTFGTREIKDFTAPSLPEYERVSLFEPYSVDYKKVLRVREENMKKYPYHYNKFGIDKRSGLSLQEFWDVYDGKWPVIVTDVIPTWEAANWTRDFFKDNYGKERVTMKAVDQIADTAISAVLPDYLHFSPDLLDDLGVYSQNGLAGAVSLALPLELFYKNTHEAYPTKWTYIEDELFIPMRPNLKRDIGDWKYLDEDYFKLFPPEVRPWDAMLLWGTKYSRSSLHIDPYNWTGTNAVFSGRKRWKMYPPGQDHLLDVFKGRKSGFPLDCYKYNSPIDSFDPDLDKYPDFALTTAIEFDQLPGELLLIPTGWFHQAFNAEETIAISSQVMNTNNARVVLEEVLKVGNVARSKLPKDIDKMSPADQVRTVMSLLSEDIIKRGREITKDALDQISGEKKVLPDGQVPRK